jgi:hypothetical protein
VHQVADVENTVKKSRYLLTIEHGDIIGDDFWKSNPYILEV